MVFDPQAYGTAVSGILSLDQNGQRLMPLISGQCSTEAVQAELRGEQNSLLFPQSVAPNEALAGLWLYFSCLEEAHELVQDVESSDAYFWHGIVHRQEPDSGNAAYWFRKLGTHAIFTQLRQAADTIVTRQPGAEFRTGGRWDPYSFVMFCERARQQPGSVQERAALEIQRAEWQLLFDHCARTRP